MQIDGEHRFNPYSLSFERIARFIVLSPAHFPRFPPPSLSSLRNFSRLGPPRLRVRPATFRPCTSTT